MVNGLSLFKERFQSFNDCYTVIGGTACSILMGNVKTDKDPSGFSAMLLSDEYYNLAMQGREQVDGVWTLQASHLIPLKMHAWLNLNKDFQKGKAIDENDLLKHKYDVFRLLLLLSEDTRVACNAKISKDITAFIDSMENEDLPAESIFGDWAPEEFRANFNKEQDLERLRMIYLT
jgi:hypothetical protein